MDNSTVSSKTNLLTSYCQKFSSKLCHTKLLKISLDLNLSNKHQTISKITNRIIVDNISKRTIAILRKRPTTVSKIITIHPHIQLYPIECLLDKH